MTRILVALAILVYVALVKWGYIALVAPYFGYMGFNYRPLSLLWELGVTGLAMLPVLWIPLVVTRPSQVAYWFLFLTVYIPSNTFPYYALFKTEPLAILPLSAALVLGFMLMGAAYRLPLIAIPTGRLKVGGFTGLIVLATVAMNGILAANFGVKTSLPGLSDVYETRFEFRDSIAEVAGARQVAYALNWLGQVFNPLLMVYGLLRRRFLLLGLGLMGQFYIYSLTGLKGIVFSGCLILGVLVFLRRHGTQFGLWMSGGFAAILGAMCLIDTLTGGYTVSSLFFRRMIVTPGLLTGAYYDFFSENPKAMLGHSILAPFVDYPYAVTPPYLIGDSFFHNPAINANANIWADGYANFGLAGIVGVSLLVAVIFNLYDGFTRRLDFKFAAAYMGIGAFSLTNSALLPTLLTHGLLVVLVLVAIMPEESPAETAAATPDDGPSERPPEDRPGPDHVADAA